MTEIQKQAYNDYLNSMKYTDIAEKYNVPLSTVKTWANRYFKKKQVSNETAETLENETVKPPRKKGGQAGNTNTVKHGAYCQVFEDTFDETEREIFNSMDTDSEKTYNDELKLCTIRERRILQRIQRINQESENGKKPLLEKVTKINGAKVDKDKNITTEEQVISEVSAIHGVMKTYEAELTKISAQKIKCMAALDKLRTGKDGENNSAVDDWIMGVMSND